MGEPIDMATQALQPARTLLPMQAAKASRMHFLQPVRAQVPAKREVEMAKNVIRAWEKKELTPAMEKNFIREIAPALTSAAAIGSSSAAHAGAFEKIVGYSAVMPILVLIGVVGGLVLLKVEQLFPNGFAED